MKVDQYLYLQDFPKDADDLKALISIGFKKLNCLNIIEEIFNREIEDENDDINPSEDKQCDPVINVGEDGIEQPPVIPEKQFNRMIERVNVFENCVDMNRVLKTQPDSSELRNCLV